MKTWEVQGFILGDSYPDDKVQVNSACVRHLTEDEVSALKKRRVAPITFETNGAGFSVVPPRSSIDALWGVFFRLNAASRDEAFERAQLESVPLLVASLVSLSDEPYRIELIPPVYEVIGARLVPPEKFISGESVFIEVMERERIKAAKFEVAVAHCDTIAADSEALKAARYLHTGCILADSAIVLPSTRAPALQMFFLCLETICQAVASRVPTRLLSDEQHRIVNDLAQVVNGTGSLGRKISTIQEAHSEVRRLRNQGFAEQARLACEALSLTEAILSEAKEYYDFRNKFLGHGGRLLEAADAAVWLDGKRAYHLAARFLSHYATYLEVVR